MNLAKTLAIALVLCVSWPAAGRGQVVYHEAFNHYGFTMPAFTDSCSLVEWPPSLKHLEFRPTRPDAVYKGGVCKLPAAAQGLTDYEFEFQFRFPKDGPKTLDFRLQFLVDATAKTPKYSSCTMRISDDWSGVTSVSDFKPRLPAVRTAMKETPLCPVLRNNFTHVFGTCVAARYSLRTTILEVNRLGQPLSGSLLSRMIVDGDRNC